MTVSDDRLGLADIARRIDRVVPPAPGIRPRPRRPVPMTPPADLTELPGYLRATTTLADGDDLATADAACQVAIRAAERWQSPSALAAAYSLRASVGRRLGRLTSAERDGQVAADLFEAAGADPRGEAAVTLLARRIAIRLDVGDVPGADRLLAEPAATVIDGPGELTLRYVRGRLHAAAGRPGEGVADLFHCGERLAARGEDRPSQLPWRSAAAQILASIGTVEAATRLVSAEVAMARRGGPAAALGRALRVQGTVHGGPPGIAALTEAARLLENSPRRFEYAQVLVALGELLNAARRRPQARRVLREGLDLAQHCGSPALARHARERYVAAGGRPRPVE